VLAKSGLRFVIFSILALVLGVVSSGLSQDAEASIEEAVIDEVRGEAKIIDENNRPRAARAGGYVLCGEIIETGHDGFVRIVFPDESALELREDTRINLNDSRVNEGAISSILLFIGRIFAEVEPADGETSFEVETLTSVCGVRGTAFTAAVGADGATRIGVDEGKVAVRADGQEVELGAGEETTVELGAARLAKSPYARSEEDWEEWRKKREQHLIQNADTLVQEMMRQVVIPRKLLRAQDRKLKAVMGQYRNWEKQQGYRYRPRPQLTPNQKQELKKMVRNYYILTRTLQKADNRMMASYYLIQRVSEDADRHPEKYGPEFIVKLDQVKAQMNELDIPKIHEDNRRVIENHAKMLQKILKRYKKQAELKGRLSEEQREKLRQHMEQRRKSRPL
jgi:hypothetical protein